MKTLSVIAFLVVVLAILFTLLTRFTNMGSGGKTYSLSAFFENTGGVMEGNPVRMVGKAIGQVKDIALDTDKRGVKMTLNIDIENKIPKDSILKIAEKGMLGEMYLSFSYGVSTEYYQEGDVVKGNPPKGLMDFMGSAEGGFQEGIDSFKEVASELKEVLAHLNEVLAAEGMKQNLADTIATLPAAIKETTQLFKENRSTMKDTLLEIKDLSNEGGLALKKINELLTEFKQGETIQDLKGTLANTKQLTQNINQGLVESKVLEKLSATLESYRDLGVKLSVSANQLQPLMSSFESGHEGTLSKLLHDPTVHDKLDRFLVAGTALLRLLEEQPNSIIFGKRRSKTTHEKAPE